MVFEAETFRALVIYGPLGIFFFFGMVVLWKLMRWLVRRGDELVDRHLKFIDSLEVTILEIRDCGEKTSDSMINLGNSINAHAERENAFMEKISECQVTLAEAAKRAAVHA